MPAAGILPACAAQSYRSLILAGGLTPPRHRRDSEKERCTSYSSLTHRVGKPPVRICLHADGSVKGKGKGKGKDEAVVSALFVCVLCHHCIRCIKLIQTPRCPRSVNAKKFRAFSGGPALHRGYGRDVYANPASVQLAVLTNSFYLRWLSNPYA